MTSTGPVTLGNLIAANKLLWYYCTACGHERDLEPSMLPLPGDTPVPDVRWSMRCTRCGAKKADTRPELYPGGIIAMRERWRSDIHSR
jgi:hypothetical protein